MTSKITQWLVVLLLVFFAGAVALSYSDAQAETQATADQLNGTYDVTIDTGTERVEHKALVDPEFVTFGNARFLQGTVSGTVKDVIKENVFTGETALIPLGRIVHIQRVATD